MLCPHINYNCRINNIVHIFYCQPIYFKFYVFLRCISSILAIQWQDDIVVLHITSNIFLNFLSNKITYDSHTNAYGIILLVLGLYK